MQYGAGYRQGDKAVAPSRAGVSVWAALCVALGGSSPALVLAQSGKLGAYAGTINVSGTEVSPQVTYRATIKINLPVTERDGSSITSDFITEDAPNASVLVSQWDSSFKEKSADSDGKFSSWSCTLATPVEIPMKPTGILNVDLKKKPYVVAHVTFYPGYRAQLRAFPLRRVQEEAGAVATAVCGCWAPGCKIHLAADGCDKGTVRPAWDLRLAR
jgi:hypothetical protein